MVEARALRGSKLLVAAAVLGSLTAGARAQSGSNTPVAGGGAMSPTGGYGAAVPLDLPRPRGPLPLPLAVTYTGLARAGAAGAGWDVPISYVAKERAARHKPRSSAQHAEIPDRVMLSLGGGAQRMVKVDPSGIRYVPYLADAYMELTHFGDDTWRLRTLDNLEYVFVPAAHIEGGAEWANATDLWLLREIRDQIGTDKVVLHYDTAALGTCSADLRVKSLSYGYGGDVPLYEVTLDYDGWWHSEQRQYDCAHRDGPMGQLWAGTFDSSFDDLLPTGRTTALTDIRVHARDNLHPSEAAKTIRSYHFSYAADPDTGKPRLSSVVMHGEDEVGTLPVATYHYGSLADPATPEVRYGAPVAVARSPQLPAQFRDRLDGNYEWTEGLLQGGVTGTREHSRATHFLRDLTGDGIPDEVWKDGDRWKVARGRVTAAGVDLAGPISTWDEPRELFQQTTFRYSGATQSQPWARAAAITTETWTFLTDWNGDGRPDVVDARGGEDSEHWRVWINRDDGDGGVAWRDVQVDVAPFRAYQHAHGLDNLSETLSQVFPLFDWPSQTPVARSKSWPRSRSFACKQYLCPSDWLPGMSESLCTEDAGRCSDLVSYSGTSGSDTIAEWTVADVNEDGYPDLAANGGPVVECESDDALAVPRDPDDHNITYPPRLPGRHYVDVDDRHAEELRLGSCDGSWQVEPSVAFLNRLGAVTDVQDVVSPYPERPVNWPYAEHWVAGTTLPEPGETAALTDAPGDYRWQHQRIADTGTRGGLMLDVTALPAAGAGALFTSDALTQCEDGGNSAPITAQVRGEVDVNGDGLLDIIESPGALALPTATSAPSWNEWSVRIGGVLGAARPIMTEYPSRFALGETQDSCSGDSPRAIVALLDLDGDGLPEIVRLGGVNQDELSMSSLVAAGGGELGGVGRLIAVDNGYGATTSIHYDNAKRDTRTRHAVPFPEIVVSRVEAHVLDGTAPDPAPVYFRYGDAALTYDGMATRWTFSGYRRQLTLAGLPAREGGVDGVLTFYDFAEPASPYASFADKAVAGRLQRIARGEGSFSLDRLDDYVVAGPPVRFAETTFAYGVAQLPQTSEPDLSDPSFLADCLDVDDGSLALGSDTCFAAGVFFRRATESWEGNSLVTFNNTRAGNQVLSVDAWGRPTEAQDQGDLWRTDDDVCTTLVYGNGAPFPSVVTSTTLTDCGLERDGAPRTLARSEYRYDGLPFGQVARGRVTERWVDVYGDTGLLGRFQAAAYTYDANGEVASVVSSRALGDPSTRTQSFTRDEFGATVTGIESDASDVAARFTRTMAISTWPSQGMRVTQPSGVARTVSFDAFGRALVEGVEVDGRAWTLRRTRYDDDPAGRRLIVETFPGDTASGAEDAATDRQRATTVVDALGRPRFTQSELGASYDETTLISGLVQYDALGRVAFAAAPFESPDLPFSPESLSGLPYGTTNVFDRRGRVVKRVEAEGWNDQAIATSVPDRIYVAEFEYGYQLGQARVVTIGADEHDSTSPRAGQRDEALLTGIGRETRRVRRDAQLAQLDVVDQAWDRLGRIVSTTRYADPVAMTGAAVWTSRFDSLGRRLSMSQPGMSDETATYDEDGNPIETAWYDGPSRRTVRASYDGFGRLTARVLASGVPGMPETVESDDRYHYDAHSGKAEQPAQPAARLLGRLSWASGALGSIYYGYDALGRGDTEVYAYQGPGVFQQHTERTIGGEITELDLTTPLTTDRIGYSYDSAARLTSVALDGVALATTNRVSALGQVGLVEYGNGVAETFTYGPAGRRELEKWEVSTASGDHAFQTLGRDAVGRITTEREVTPSATTTYASSFDSLGRLSTRLQTGGVMPGLEWFTYDGLGNLQTRTSTTGSGNRIYTAATADPDRLCRFAATAGGCQFVYDGAGNVVIDTSSSLRTFSYDAAQRLRSISKDGTSVAMAYGPAGRVKTEVTGQNPRTIWRLGSLMEQRDEPSGLVQIERSIPGPRGANISLRTRTAGGSTTTEVVYAHGDGRANRLFTRADGSVVQSATYAAYGDLTSNATGPALTTSDDLWNGGDNLPEVGLVVLGPRTYDPAMGRFLQRDPIAFLSRSTTGNPYGFGFNDPVNLADPSGLSPDGSQNPEGRPDLASNIVGWGLAIGTAAYYLGFDHDADEHPPSAAVAVGASQLKVGTTGLPFGMFSGGSCGISVWCHLKDGIRNDSDEVFQAQQDFETGWRNGEMETLQTLHACTSGTGVCPIGPVATAQQIQTAVDFSNDPEGYPHYFFCQHGCWLGIGTFAEHTSEQALLSGTIAAVTAPVVAGGISSEATGLAVAPGLGDALGSEGFAVSGLTGSGTGGPIPAPSGWTRVSRWMSPKEATLWEGRSSIPQPVGNGMVASTDVTVFGAAQPGGTGPVRVDFSVPTGALQGRKVGADGPGNTWWRIYSHGRLIPIRDLIINGVP